MLHKFHLLKLLFTAITLMMISLTYAQDSKRIKLLGADELIGKKINGRQIQVLDGNARLQHENMFFYCDSANLDRKSNGFKAWDKVHIIINDSVNIYSDSLYYDGNSRLAELFGEVILIDNKATLYTDYLKYNRNLEIASYVTWGRIVDSDNELLSKIGYYYSDLNEFYFMKDVIVNSSDYVMYSDTMKYNTDTEIVYIFGPTKIIGEEDSVYCENGWYDTKQDIARLQDNAFVRHLEQYIKGDTLYHDKHGGYGEAFNNIVLFDSVQDAMVKGNYAYYLKEGNQAYVTDSSLAIFIDSRDSLYLHGDTLKVLLDSSNSAKELTAFNHVKFYREDLQGACDSLVYKTADSIIVMYRDPVIWSDDNQLTADSILLALKENALDSIVFYNSCFIISKDDSGAYNQIKGKTMIGYFRENDLYKLVVKGNSETIYFVREEDGSLMGVNKAISSDMLILLEDRKIKTITYVTMPQATLYPKDDLHPQDLELRGFRWHGHQRPGDKYEIFQWNDETVETLED